MDFDRAVANGGYSGEINAARIVLGCALGWVELSASPSLDLARAGRPALDRVVRSHRRATSVISRRPCRHHRNA